MRSEDRPEKKWFKSWKDILPKHTPMYFTSKSGFLHFAILKKHSLKYILPSVPHTGNISIGQLFKHLSENSKKKILFWIINVYWHKNRPSERNSTLQYNETNSQKNKFENDKLKRKILFPNQDLSWFQRVVRES